jgi:hypothetical protein
MPMEHRRLLGFIGNPMIFKGFAPQAGSQHLTQVVSKHTQTQDNTLDKISIKRHASPSG